MSIVRRLEPPDFFRTLICSPDWAEFKEAASFEVDDNSIIEQSPQDRPDLITRISKLKFYDIINDIDSDKIFGNVAAYVYVYDGISK